MAKIERLAGIALAIWSLAAGVLAADPPTLRLESAAKIWAEANHNAFTDLLRHDGLWLCTFREGSAHIPGTDGKIRVIASADGVKWESRALIEEKGVDLRDPKLSVAPDGRLMMVMGGSYYDGTEPTPGRKRTGSHSRVSFSKTGADWTPTVKVEGIEDNHWLWRVTWHKGVGYATVYGAGKPAGGKRQFHVYRTADGIKYENPIDTGVPAPGGEATARFAPDDTLTILFRSEDPKNRNAFVGVSRPPYDKWEWKDAAHPAQGPNFIHLKDGRTFYAGRDFENGKTARTVVGQMTPAGLLPLLTLPSGGDTSYPGIVEAEPNLLWISYYASHEGKTSVYLAKVRIGG